MAFRRQSLNQHKYRFGPSYTNITHTEDIHRSKHNLKSQQFFFVDTLKLRLCSFLRMKFDIFKCHWNKLITAKSFSLQVMVPKIKVHHKNVCGIWHIWGKKTMRHQATFRVELFGLQFFNRLLMFKMDISATFSTVENKFMQNFAHLLEHQR